MPAALRAENTFVIPELIHLNGCNCLKGIKERHAWIQDVPLCMNERMYRLVRRMFYRIGIRERHYKMSQTSFELVMTLYETSQTYLERIYVFKDEFDTSNELKLKKCYLCEFFLFLFVLFCSDYGFERRGDGNCLPAFWFNPSTLSRSCSQGQNYLNSTG